MAFGKIRFPSTIKDGQLQFLSVSQAEKYSGDFGCPTAWGFHYIDKIRPEQTKAAAFGDESHKQIDHYLNTGEDVLGAVLRPGKHLIYDPGPGIEIEHESMGEIAIDGVPFYVRLDLLNLRDYYLDPEGERRPLNGAAEVNDWKTTGDIAKKAKFAQALVETVQMATYGAWALVTKRPHTHVRLSHTYFSTGKRGALKTTVLATAEQIEERIYQISGVVERMKRDASASSGKELERNYDTCHKTRAGCPYLSICPRDIRIQLADACGAGLASRLLSDQDASTEATHDMSALDFLNSLAAGKVPAAAPQTPVAPAAPVAPPVQAAPAPVAPVAPGPATWNGMVLPPGVTPEMMEGMVKAQLQAAQAGPQGAPALAPPVAQMAGASPGAGLAGNGPNGVHTITQPGQLPFVPPDAPASGSQSPAATPIPPEQLATMPANVQAAAQAVAAQTPAVVAPAAVTVPQVFATPAVTTPAAAAVETTTPSSPPAEAPKRGRGRPKKSENGGGGNALTTPGLVLLVDPRIVDGLDAEPLEPYIDDLHARIVKALNESEKTDIGDIRLAGADSKAGFAKWKGLISMFVQAEPPAPGIYTLHVEGSEIREIVAQALRTKCVAYVRG